jgi:hypothetical protein
LGHRLFATTDCDGLKIAQFKAAVHHLAGQAGGLGNENRRFMRVNLLRDILELFGFRVETVGDALNACIEKKSAPYLLNA